MRTLLIVLCFEIFLTVQCSSESTVEVYEDARNFLEYDDEDVDDSTYDDAYDDSMFFSNVLPIDGSRFVEEDKSDDTLNCFGLSEKLSKIMDSYFKKAANGTKAQKVLFYSTSRNQPTRVTMRHGDLFLLEKIDFDIRRRTIFIVHGFFSDGNEEWIMDMEKALLKWDDVNIFVVDWSDGANTWNYLKSAVNTKTVGDQIATFINQIADQTIQWYGGDTNNWGPLHFIGHSLGAHISGYAAHELKFRKSKWPVHRITGLDPAQPCFRNSNLSLRLDRSDARFVDVIHTNGRILKKLGLGLPYPLGHIDFYPNGGSVQPGCILAKSSVWKYLPLPIEKIKKTICSHGRSHSYLTESVIAAIEKNCTFWAHKWDMSYTGIENLLSKKCDNSDDDDKCIEMGINAEKYSYGGTYFSLTGRSSPFCSVDSSAIEEVKKFMEKFRIFGLRYK